MRKRCVRLSKKYKDKWKKIMTVDTADNRTYGLLEYLR